MPKKKLYLIGQVGASPEAAFFGIEHFTYKTVVDFFEGNPDDEVAIHLHSEGGSVTEGFAIANYLEGLDRDFEIIATRAESMGLPILASGKSGKRFVTPEFVGMLHLPKYSNVQVDKNKMEEALDNLKQAEEKLSQLFSRVSFRDESFWIDQLQASDNKITATQAMEWGIVDGIVQAEREVAAMAASADNSIESYLKIKQIYSMNKQGTLLAQIQGLLGGSANEIKALEIALKNGEILNIKTQEEGSGYSIGDSVTIKGQPVEDGDYMVSDGSRTLKIQGSAISEILDTPAEEAELGEDVKALALVAQSTAHANSQIKATNDMVAQMTAQLVAVEGTLKELRTLYADQQTAMASLKAELEEAKRMTSSSYTPPATLTEGEQVTAQVENGLHGRIAAMQAAKRKENSKRRRTY